MAFFELATLTENKGKIALGALAVTAAAGIAIYLYKSSSESSEEESVKS